MKKQNTNAQPAQPAQPAQTTAQEKRARSYFSRYSEKSQIVAIIRNFAILGLTVYAELSDEVWREVAENFQENNDLSAIQDLLDQAQALAQSQALAQKQAQSQEIFVEYDTESNAWIEKKYIMQDASAQSSVSVIKKNSEKKKAKKKTEIALKNSLDPNAFEKVVIDDLERNAESPSMTADQEKELAKRLARIHNLNDLDRWVALNLGNQLIEAKYKYKYEFGNKWSLAEKKKFIFAFLNAKDPQEKQKVREKETAKEIALFWWNSAFAEIFGNSLLRQIAKAEKRGYSSERGYICGSRAYNVRIEYLRDGGKFALFATDDGSHYLSHRIEKQDTIDAVKNKFLEFLKPLLLQNARFSREIQPRALVRTNEK